MDLIGKTVRWERDGYWFTMTVTGRFTETGTWHGPVVDPGTFGTYQPGETAYFHMRELVTVIDSEPFTDDPECE